MSKFCHSVAKKIRNFCEIIAGEKLTLSNDRRKTTKFVKQSWEKFVCQMVSGKNLEFRQMLLRKQSRNSPNDNGKIVTLSIQSSRLVSVTVKFGQWWQ